MAELAERAGVPAGVFSVITGSAGAIGTELCTNKTVRKVSFTGSTEVGKILLKQCADTVKRTSMELGGLAPFIVFDDADLDKAVEGAIACKFRNCGQTCVCTNRIYVQAGVYDAFAEKFAAATAKLRVGPGTAKDVFIGPMIDDKAVEKVEEHIGDATAKGATVRARRQAPPARRPVLRAHRARQLQRGDEGRPRGDLRAGGAPVPLRDRGGRDPPGQRRPTSASPATSTPATSAASSASPRRSRWAWSASTTA